MTKSATLQEIRELVKNGGAVDQSTASRLTLAVMADMAGDVQEIGEEVKDIRAVLEKMDARMKVLECNPSLIWLFKNKPVGTITVMAAFMFLVATLMTYVPAFWLAILKILGL